MESRQESRERFFPFPMCSFSAGINSFGEDAIAGSSLALNFEYFTYDIANAFAQAAVTFTSQNYGAANFEALPEDILALHGLWHRFYRNIKYCIYDLG